MSKAVVEYSNSIVMVGPPSTGKTTFLAALWHQVESSEVPQGLVLDRLRGDREYVNALARSWLDCSPVPRTPLGTTALIAMDLRDRERGKAACAVFPDMSGEEFVQQWSERSWSRAYDDLVVGCNGVMLFVHPKQVVQGYRIDQADQLGSSLMGPQDEPHVESGQIKTTEKQKAASVPWKSENAPTQVILTDLLQFIIQRRTIGAPLRVAVLVSAWDLVQRRGKAPPDWLSEVMPLLNQFLEVNDGIGEARIFGVSAQGGDLPTERNALLEMQRPSDRVRVICGGEESHDLTAPVQWLLT